VAAFTDFTDFALVITFVYFIEKQGDVMGTPSQVNSEILSAFNKAKIQFAVQMPSVYREKGGK
jgi:MscS family membrane protein